MATIDPWLWTVEDVSHFVRHSLHLHTADIPNAQLPDRDRLAQSLRDSDVPGYALLSASVVNSQFLRDECGMRSVSQRAALLHVIASLRRASRFFDQQGEPLPSNGMSASPAIISTPVLTNAPAASAPLSTVGQNIRPGEDLIEDASGRKRRRLILTAAPRPDSDRVDKEDRGPSIVKSYLGDTKTTVDSVTSPLGLAGVSNSHFQTASEGNTRGELRVVSSMLYKHQGHVQFVNQQIKRLFGSRRRRKSNRSFRAATLTQSPVTALDKDVSEWDFLLERYPVIGNDTEFPLYGDSEAGGEISSDLADEISDEEDETLRQTLHILTRSEVDLCIDQIIDEYVDLWEEKKLPRIEKRQAWTIWRKMDRSRAKRDALIQHSQGVQSHLNSRLHKIKKDLLDQEWKSEKELVKQCSIMQPTIDDREEEKWKISVWRRKQPPQHVIQHGIKSANVAAVPPDSRVSEDVDGFVADDGLQDGTIADLGADDALSLDEMLSDHEHVGDEDDSHDAVVGSDQQEAEQYDALFHKKQNLEASEDMATSDREESDCLPPVEMLIKQSPSQTSSKEPIKTSLVVNEKPHEIIELSSDDNPPPVRKRKGREMGSITRNWSKSPENATSEEIESWSFLEMEALQNRPCLIIKLIHDLPAETKRALQDYLQPSKDGEVVEQMVQLFKATGSAHDRTAEGGGFTEEAVTMAKLCRCWHLASTTFWDQPLREGLDHPILRDHLQVCVRFTSKQLLRIMRMQRLTAAPVYVLSDDDETADISATPHKKRKREVKQDQTARAARQLAHARVERFTKEITDPAMLLQMVPDSHQDGEPVIVQIGKGGKSREILLNPGLACRLKPHQIEGVRFMWRELTVPKEEGGQGCLLAHTMGLGKTAQAIALLVCIVETGRDKPLRDQLPRDLRKKKGRELRILVLCPPVLVQNWMQEITKWSPRPAFFSVRFVDSTHKKGDRLADLNEWSREGGILLLGYQMFQRYVNGQPAKSLNAPTEQEEAALARKILLEEANIVIADEAHTLKNEMSSVSKAARQIKTQRRIALTGSPMSNNTQEIYALINWVAPDYLDTAQWFRANYAEPIEQGTYKESTGVEKRLSLKKLWGLKHEIGPKVNRADITVLKGSLKSKTEFVLTVPLTETQSQVYSMYVKLINSHEDSKITQARLFGWIAILRLLCNHPFAFREKLMEKKPAAKKHKGLRSNHLLDASLLDTVLTAHEISPSPPGETSGDGDELGDEHVSALGFTEDMLNQLKACLPDDFVIEHSRKTQLVKDIIELSLKANDKVLVFSHSLLSLGCMERLCLEVGVTWARIDGTKTTKAKYAILDDFRRGSYGVLLMSTRAGGLGLNIQEANRVIIFDSGFNPSHEEQAIGRSYRLGQQKPVFVYRFVAGGTFEYRLHDKQLHKIGLAFRVVDEKNPARNGERRPKDWMCEPKETPQENIDLERGKDPMVLDRMIEKHDLDGRDIYIRAIQTMETLQEEAEDLPLTTTEMQEVQAEIALKKKKVYVTSPPPQAEPSINVSGGLATSATAAALPREELPSSSAQTAASPAVASANVVLSTTPPLTPHGNLTNTPAGQDHFPYSAMEL